MTFSAQFSNLVLVYNSDDHLMVVESGKTLAEQFPDQAMLLFLLGSSCHILGRHNEAIDYYRSAIKLEPSIALAHVGLGNLLLTQDQAAESIPPFQQAIDLGISDLLVFNNLGNALLKTGNFADACANYHKAIDLDPACSAAYQNLAIAQTALGQTLDAIASYREAIRLNPDLKLSKYNLASILQDKVPQHTKYCVAWAQTYLEILRTPGIINPTALSAQILQLLKQHPFLKTLLGELAVNDKSFQRLQATERLSEIPLLLQFISKSPATDLQIENLLAKVREDLLSQAADLDSYKEASPIQIALALHYYINEYVVTESNSEHSLVLKLETELEKEFAHHATLNPCKVTAIASYRQLTRYRWKDRIATMPSMHPIYTMQIKEAELESMLAQSIQQLSEPEDAVSLLVRSQYEENPYPRWIDTRMSHLQGSIAEVMQSTGIRICPEHPLSNQNPQILIAGCGTGQQALVAASRFENSRILAIDLSRRSLAYAQRKSAEHAVRNIEFMHADILALGKLGRQFDLIECVGVLHHMAEPLTGWRVITDCLRTGGMMKIGLYSAAARQPVADASNVIRQRAVGKNTAEILQFRKDMLAADFWHKSQLRDLAKWPDFYTTSEFRDLVFHVQEHRFDLLQINSVLDQLNLRFAGFEFADNRMKDNFRSIYQHHENMFDLNLWHRFEMNNLETFSGMYQFWVQKMGNGKDPT